MAPVNGNGPVTGKGVINRPNLGNPGVWDRWGLGWSGPTVWWEGWTSQVIGCKAGTTRVGKVGFVTGGEGVPCGSGQVRIAQPQPNVRGM